MLLLPAISNFTSCIVKVPAVVYIPVLLAPVPPEGPVPLISNLEFEPLLKVIFPAVLFIPILLPVPVPNILNTVPAEVANVASPFVSFNIPLLLAPFTVNVVPLLPSKLTPLLVRTPLLALPLSSIESSYPPLNIKLPEPVFRIPLFELPFRVTLKA